MTGSRLITGGRLVIASHNSGKVDEFAALLAPFKTQVVSAAGLGLPEPVESGATFAANAEIKASSAARHSGLPAMADDSGLVVDALGGAPGILSARWAGPGRDFALAMKKVEADLEGTDDRRAHFACALTLGWPDGHSESFLGEVHGRLVWPPKGTRGLAVSRPMGTPTSSRAPATSSDVPCGMTTTWPTGSRTCGPSSASTRNPSCTR